jgi:hypothetical protein
MAAGNVQSTSTRPGFSLTWLAPRLVVVTAVLLGSTACGTPQVAEQSASTNIPIALTATVEPTPTQAPTPTPAPTVTNTPEPTNTTKPTDLPAPTNTPEPTTLQVTATIMRSGNILDKPISEGSTVVGQLNKGVSVKLRRRLSDNSWFLIDGPASYDGWVPGDLLKYDPDVAQQIEVDPVVYAAPTPVIVQVPLTSTPVIVQVPPTSTPAIASVSYERLGSYTAAGKTWHFVLVSPALDRPGIIEIARQLHKESPGTYFHIVNDASQVEAYAAWDVNYPDDRFPYPESWASQHMVADIQQMTMPPPTRWVILLDPSGLAEEVQP